MTLPPIEQRLLAILDLTCEFSRPCRACGAMIYFVRTREGKLNPYTAAGISHFADCPKAAQFQKPKQDALFAGAGEYPG